VQLTAEKEILIVVASLVHCCAIKKNIIVASKLYDVANVRFTVEFGLPGWHFSANF